MNAFPNGTRVFWFGATASPNDPTITYSGVIYGIVVATGRLEDGTQLLDIEVEGALDANGNPKIIMLPAAAVNLVIIL